MPGHPLHRVPGEGRGVGRLNALFDVGAGR